MKLTAKQLVLMRHSVSDRGRNWFGTTIGSEDATQFERLVSDGLATKQQAPSWVIDDVIYRLTEKGLAAIN